MSSKESIERRIAEKLADNALELKSANICQMLAENLSGSDLHSLLLEVIKRRIDRIEQRALLSANSVTGVCNLNARLLHKVEQIQLQTASFFELVELSPLNPLGSVHLLTGLDQANVLSTIRAFECSSDPTIGLALECARRRKTQAERKKVHKLCTSQRVVRFPLPSNPAYSAHFKLFCLITAGRDSGSFSFETEALREQIGIYLAMLSALKEQELVFQEIMVEISDMRVASHLCSHSNIDREEVKSLVRARDQGSSERLLDRYGVSWPRHADKPEIDLKEFQLPEHLLKHLSLLKEQAMQPLLKSEDQTSAIQCSISFNFHRLTGLGYYRGSCFHIKARNHEGNIYTIADGGFVDWTQSLLSDTKERLLTSAIGTEQLCRMFGVKGG